MKTTENQGKPITAGLILSRLQAKVSVNNAKLLLDSAKITTGIMVANEIDLSSEQAKTLCLNLINSGGPAFHVGQAIYKEYLM